MKNSTQHDKREDSGVLDTLAIASDTNSAPVLSISYDGTLRYANAGAWLVLRHWSVCVGARVPEPWASLVQTVGKTDRTEERTLRVGHVSLRLMFVPDGNRETVYVFGADITSRRRIEKDRLIKAHIYAQAHEAIVVTDDEFRTIDINMAYTRLTGFTEADALGEPPSFIVAAKRDVSLFAEISQALADGANWRGEIWDRTKGGAQIAVRILITAVTSENNSVTHYLAFITDISFHKEAEEQLRRIAHYDGLTGLPNRYLLEDYIHNAISQARRTGEGFAIMVVDLNGFTQLNDTHGHRVGDKMLQHVSRQMVEAVRTGDAVARYSGDGFVVLARNITTADTAEIVARKVLTAISTPTRINELELSTTASIGVLLYPTNQTEIEPLLRKVDNAMQRVEHGHGSDVHFFSDAMREKSDETFRIQNELRRAISDGSICVQYQPQIDITSGTVIGVEALARWTDPVFGKVPPSRFIPIAENSGLIHELGEHVLLEACRQGRNWIDTHGVHIRVGVNVSVRQLQHREFSNTVERMLTATGFPAADLEIELTETVFINDANGVLPTLHDLADMGVCLAIDDFGTRYASLMYIKLFPIHRLKIDQAFVQDLPQDTSATQIVTAIIALAKSLDCGIIAEGVETIDQLRFLSNKGCTEIQGYLCSPPIEQEHLAKILTGGCMQILDA